MNLASDHGVYDGNQRYQLKQFLSFQLPPSMLCHRVSLSFVVV